MSPVFGHGRLRLYLLKLLEESPRHGYEVIRLLQDRFLGVYSPSPGTIYPRLGRLEEEGLVTHEVVEGKKVYSLTDKGREELNDRLDELDDLEQEISASVRDIAREVKEDVRDTVKSLREELTRMARDVRTDPPTDAKRLRDRQREATRLAEQQKRRWMEHAYQLQSESERLSGDVRRIWEETWARFGGPATDRDPADAALEVEFTTMLVTFLSEMRQEAADVPLTREKLTDVRTALDTAARQIRETLG
ncbi:PadR family transcriptional regulator [Nonomuraea sp. NN258]|uniref:PadR family transcriptional regulator n=1 Tax=Nonomuraea antri TaxID=2730852 RepID=UPI0015682CB6|nr:helix-turn-helix transcriptional regulator [Nonomuraea antri]NRQ37461.1 PadR family transcriptional regulator [Nonomuraea antri]